MLSIKSILKINFVDEAAQDIIPAASSNFRPLKDLKSSRSTIEELKAELETLERNLILTFWVWVD